MTIFQSYNNTKKALEKAGIEDYVFEAKQIIKHITGLTSAQILTDYAKELSEFQMNNLTALIKQRELRYPLQYIFGKWSFYGNEFFVGPGVLIPRADTETLIDKALGFLKGNATPDILDLCTGSGCIGITLAKSLPRSLVLMVEKYKEAASYAEKNIQLNGVSNAKLLSGDVFEGTGSDGEYDLIVSNPPYIPANEMDAVSPETKFEPETALAGGNDGLNFYRTIIKNYKKSLKNGAMMAFEVGLGESDAVAALFKQNDFTEIGTLNDFNGIKRVVFALTK